MSFLRWIPGAFALPILLVACTSEETSLTDPGPGPELPPPAAERPDDPGLSYEPGCLATLPVENRFVGGGVLPDAIPALVDPAFLPVESVNYLGNDDLILGAEIQGRFFAFPVKIMNYHEIANFSLEGERYAATWCPLAYTYMLFRNPRWKDAASSRSAAFRVSGSLMDDNLVMFDVETRSLWPQLLGMAVVGPASGECLVVERNVTTTTWSAWRRLHPATVVLSDQNEARTGIRPSAYDRDPYISYHASSGSLHEPTYEDERLPAKTIILGVHADGQRVALRLRDPIRQVDLGATRAVFFMDLSSGATFGFERNLDGVTHSFTELGTDEAGLPTFLDPQSESVWSLDGIAISGSLKGRRLAQLPTVESYWFAWSSLFHGTELR